MHSRYELEMLAIELAKQELWDTMYQKFYSQGEYYTSWTDLPRKTREAYRKLAQQMLEENEYDQNV